MPKSANRAQSRHSREAVTLLGGLVRAARKTRKMTVQEVAERAGISRGLVHRIEGGDLNCAIGAAFEVAAIVGLKLFDAERNSMVERIRQIDEKLTLLPKSVRKKSKVVTDDF